MSGFCPCCGAPVKSYSASEGTQSVGYDFQGATDDWLKSEAGQRVIERALHAIHGSVVPLPNRATPREYASLIAYWMREVL